MTKNKSRLNAAKNIPITRWTFLTLAAAVMLLASWPAAAQESGPPERPTGLTGTVAHDQVTLSWDDPQDSAITGYQILRRDPRIHEAGRFDPLLNDTGTAQTSHTDRAVESGARYIYRVRARSAAGLSPQSSYFQAHVPQPPAIAVSFEQAAHAVTEGQSVQVAVALDQDPQREMAIPLTAAEQGGASGDDYSGVPSQITFNSGVTRQVITLTATDDAEDDDGESVLLTFGASLPDRVSAGTVNETTVSITDNEEQEPTPPTQPPTKPTGLTGTATHKAVSLTWDDPQDDTTTSYQVLRRDKSIHEPGEFLIHVDDTSSTTPAYTDTAVIPEGNYTYRVKARNAAGLSSQSTYFDARIPQPPEVTVSFEQAIHSVEEGQSAAITVLLDTDPQRDVSIPIVAAGQDGASGADYSGVPSEVTFIAGETRQVITLTATDDSEDDDGESVKLDFGTLPDRVSAGSVSETAVSITDNDEPVATDSNTTPATATDLGDITGLERNQFPKHTLDGAGDSVDYFKFTLTAPKQVSLGLRQQKFNADLALEDNQGETLKLSQKEGTSNEAIHQVVLEGTYFIRVEAQETGENEYKLRYGVTEPNADKVKELRDKQDPGSSPQTARDLGDITDATETRTVNQQVLKDTDDQDYYRFSLTERKAVRVTITNQDADADLYIEDADGGALGNSRNDGTDDEQKTLLLIAGAYLIIVEAQGAGANDYTLGYQTSEPTGHTGEILAPERTTGGRDEAVDLGGVAERASTSAQTGTAYLWIEDWVERDALAHDVTEGQDIVWTIKRNVDLSGNVNIGLSFNERAGSPDYTNFVDHSQEDNSRPDWVQIKDSQDSVTVRMKTTDDTVWERDSWLNVCIVSYPTDRYSLYQSDGATGHVVRNCTSFRIRDNDPGPTILPYRPDEQPFTITEGDSATFELWRYMRTGQTSPHMTEELTIYVKIKELFTNYEEVVDPPEATHQGFPVTFAANAATAEFTYQTTDNDVDNPDRFLGLRVEADHTASSIRRPRWGLTVHNEAVFRVNDDEKPTITIAADASSFSEDAGSATFTLTRRGDTSAGFTVNLTVTQVGEFLQNTPPTRVTFTAGSDTAPLRLALDDDDRHEEDGSVTAALAEHERYELGDDHSATATLENNDAAQRVYVESRKRPKSPSPNAFTLAEVEEGNEVSFRIRRREQGTDSLVSDNIANLGSLTISLQLETQGDFTDGDTVTIHTITGEGDNWESSTVTPNDDGTLTATIPAGQDELWVTVETVDDQRLWYPQEEYSELQGSEKVFQPAYEDDGSISLTVLAGTNYIPGRLDSTDAQAQTTVLDNEPPMVNITRTSSPPPGSLGPRTTRTIEGDTWTLWINRYFHNTDNPLDVRYIFRPNIRCTQINHLTNHIQTRDALPEENLIPESLRSIQTATIPAGQRSVQIELPSDDDLIPECSFRVTARILPPENAEVIKQTRPRQIYHLQDFPRWTYHSIASTAPSLLHPTDGQGARLSKAFSDFDNFPRIRFDTKETSEDENYTVPQVWLTHNRHRWDYTVEWWTQDGSATAGTDYVAARGTVTLPAEPDNPDLIKRDIRIPLLDDNVYEGNENIIINYRVKTPFSDDYGEFVLLATQNTRTIRTIIDDNESAPKISISRVTGPEGDVDMNFPVRLEHPSTKTITANWATRSRTNTTAATPGEDYTAASGTLTFSPGETQKEIRVALTADELVEGTEEFHVDLSSPVNSECIIFLNRDLCTARGQITDQSPDPHIVLEGPQKAVNESAGHAEFLVSLLHSNSGDPTHSNRTVTVAYATEDGNGDDGNNDTAVAGEDYTGLTGTLTFSPGDRTKTVRVPITDDDRRDRSREHFRLKLSNPTNSSFKPVDENGAITPTSIGAAATIMDNDPLPRASITDLSTQEPAASDGTVNAALTISLDRPSDRTPVLRAATRDGTAESGMDYEALSETQNLQDYDYKTIRFPNGATENTVNVTIKGDSIDEDDETFEVVLGDANNFVEMEDDRATITIANQTPPPKLHVVSNIPTTEQASPLILGFRLHQPDKTDDFGDDGTPSAKRVTFAYTTADGNFSADNAISGEDFTRRSGTVAIEPGATDATIEVSLVEDDLHEEQQERFRIILSAPSNVVFSNGNSTMEITVIIRDSDQAPLATIEDASIEENGGEMTFTVTLNHPSSRTGTLQYWGVGMSPQNDYTAVQNTDFRLDRATLTFGPMETEKTITAQIIDDEVDEPDETFLVLINSPGGSIITTGSDDRAVGTIVDDDLPSGEVRRLVFNPAVLQLDEEDTDGESYTVKLSHQPVADVTVTIATQAQSELTVNKTSLTFTTSNWDTVQTATITPSHDDDGHDDREKVAHTAAEADDGEFDDVTGDLTVSVDDDDQRRIIVEPTTINVTEEDPDGNTYGVRLATKPRIDVPVIFDLFAKGLTGNERSLTFTPDNWDTPQMVKVTAGHDDDFSDRTVTVRHWNLGHAYSIRRTTLTVNVIDDDRPAILTDPASVTVTEEDTDGESFSVTLASQPLGDVTVTPVAHSRLTVSPPSLTFTQDNWDSTQKMSVTAGSDPDADAEDETLDFTAAGGSYDQAQGRLQVRVLDDDNHGVNVSETSLTVPEGESRNYSLVLGEEPTGDVTVTINDPGNSEITAAPDSFTFTTSNWDTEQTVTVSAAHDDDHLDEDADEITHTISGGGYDDVDVDSVFVTVRDDDDPIVKVSYDQETATVTEGSVVTVTATLDSKPGRTVQVPITVDNQGGASNSDYSAIPSSVTFNRGDTSKSFTFTITDDDQDDDGESIRLSFGALPDRVQLRSSGNRSVTITIRDNDDRAVVVEPIRLTIEEGSTGSYTVVLQTEPTATVTVTVTVDDTDDAPFTVSSTSTTLNFTTADWSTEQTVTVRATQDRDGVDENPYTIIHTVAGGDYDGAPADDVTVTVTDDDGPPVEVSFKQSVYTVDEGDSVQVTVTLDADPGREVTIPISMTDQDTEQESDRGTRTESSYASSSDYSGAPSSVTFDAGETEKSFNITATEDTASEDDEIIILSFANLTDGVSLGKNYSSTVRIEDDDAPSVTVSFDKASYTVAESDDTSTTDSEEHKAEVKVILSADPKQTVAIPITKTEQDGASSADYSGIPASVVFNSGETSKTITFAAAHDSVDDDGESVKLTFGTLPAQVTAGTTGETVVNITDDDKPTALTVEFGADTYTVNEGGTVTVNVTMDDDPEQTVTIPLSRTNQGGASDADLTGVPANVVFNSGDTEKTLTLNAADDNVDDDGESVKLTFGTLPTSPVKVSAGSTDEAVVTITDGDAPTVSVSFDEAAYTVDEGASVTIKVTLSADPERTVTIPITKTNEDGAENADYSGVPASVRFDSGDTEQEFSFNATDDAVDDDDEKVSLAFGTRPPGVNEGTTKGAVVSITDDDKPTSLTVSFEQSSYTVAEGSNVSVKVTLSDDPERTVTIPLSKTERGGASPSDYSGVPANVVFDSGDTEKAFTFNATSDALDDDDESVKIAFGTLPTTPVNVSAGSTDETVVNITDDNDPPVISGSAAVDHPENSTATIATYSATDPDDGATLTWTLSGADTSHFELSNDQKLSFKTGQDFEDPDDADDNGKYQVTITVSDGVLSDSIEVTVTLTDQDEGPEIANATFSTEENQTEKLGPIKVSDEPFLRATVTITLEGDEGSLFEVVDQTTTEFYIRFKSAPDHENPADTGDNNVYNITAKATEGSKNDTSTIAVTVTDAVELPTINEAKGSQSSPVATTVAENLAAIGKSYTANSNGGGTLTWSIVETPPAHEVSRASDGTLAFDTPYPDYEAMAAEKRVGLVITVNNTDGADTAYLRISISNAQEDGKVVLSDTTPDVGQTVTATLTDPDENVSEVSWQWQQQPADSSSWDNITGATSNTHKVLIAQAGGKIRAHATYSDTLDEDEATSAPSATINNRNPSFGADVSVNVAENSASGTLVTTVTADDPDASGGDSVTYSSSDLPPAFSLESATGKIKVAQPAQLDYEDDDKDVYTFSITATDQKSGTDSIGVTATVTDVNEAPVIDGGTSISHPENSTSDLEEYEADDPEGDGFTWLLSGTDSTFFTLSTSGVLKFGSAPDHEDPKDSGNNNVYNITIRAADEHGATATADVTVTVTNVDENPGLAVGNQTVNENFAGKLGPFDVSDEPIIVRDQHFTLSLKGDDAGDFEIVDETQSTFKLQFKSPPDHENPADDNDDNVYEVTVRVVDQASKSTEQSLTVTVNDMVELPTINEDKGEQSSPITTTIAENLAAIGKSYTANSNGGGDLTWSITETPSSHGVSRASDGALTFDLPYPDYETMEANKRVDLVITVRNTDGADTAYLRANISNAQEDGRVVLSNSAPNVGDTITATLSDPDGGEAETSWQWQAQQTGSSTWTNIADATSEAYQVRIERAGSTIRAQARYSDALDDDDGQTATSDPTSTINNRNPVFGPDVSVNIAENSAADTPVTTVTATDPDAAGGDTVTYSSSGLPTAFSLDTSTGQIKVSRPSELNHEDDDTDGYTFSVTATDRKHGTDSINVTVTVTDVNEAPVIDGDTSLSHPEHSTADLEDYDATDPEGNDFTWLISGTDVSYFEISTSGVLTFKNAPDHEDPKDDGKNNGYDLTVAAADEHGATGTVEVTVTVTNNDEDPDLVLANQTVDENFEGKFGPFDVSDEPIIVRDQHFTLSLRGDDAGDFTIVDETQSTFKLQFNKVPDHEDPDDDDDNNVYNLTVRVVDQANKTTDKAMTVTVRDVIELPTINEPKGTSPTPIETTINEHVAAIGKSYTADSNGGGDTLTWSITESPTKYLVTRENAGAIKFSAPVPDYEDLGTDKRVDLEITVTNDDGSDTAYLHVNITNTEEDGSVTLSPTDPDVGETITATAADPDAISGTITGAWQRSDEDSTTDWNTINGQTSNQYKVLYGDVDRHIRAVATYDDGFDTGNQATSAHTAKIANRPPAFANDAASFDLAEGSASNATVGQVTATDPDSAGGDTVTYSSSDVPDTFSINSSNGAITLAKPDDIDHEDTDKNRFTFTVTATDRHSATDTINVTVNITNTDEKPAIGAIADQNYPENATRVVVTVTASDEPLLRSLPSSIQLQGDDAALFEITNRRDDEELFDVEFRSPPDYENPRDDDTDNDYELTVRVADTKGNATSSFTVTVTDVTETPEILNDGSTSSSPVSITINENVLDPDRDYTAKSNGGGDITWSIAPATDLQAGTATEPATDQSSVGFTFRSGRAPDYEALGTNKYVDVIITATNEDASDVAYLRINISNVNEAPGFASDGDYEFDVDENSADGTDVGTVTATDPESDTVTYSITAPNNAPFAIGSSTGEITVSGSLDHETKDEYELTVKAADSNSNSSTVRVTVEVNDVNEAPEFDNDEQSFNIPESSTGGRVVGAITADDPDDGDTVTYSITPTDSPFQVNSSTGQITLKSGVDLDFDNGPKKYVFTLKATDGGTPGLSDTVEVTVNITDANEPPAPSGDATPEHEENDTSTVATYSANDPENDSITWTLSGTDAGQFTITGGALSFRNAPDYENPDDQNDDNDHVLNVLANDGENAAQSFAVTVTVTDADEPPDAPTVTISATTSASLTASWNTPTDAAKPPVTGFDVQYRQVTTPESGWTNWTHNDTSTTSEITGLTANTQYQIHVRASNAEGDGSWSTPKTGTTGKHTVEFATSSQTVQEGNTATVKLEISPRTTQSITIPLTTTGQNGATADDYSGAPTSVTFDAGDTEASVTITAADDDIDDDDEYVRIALGTMPPIAQAGSTNRTRINITDNDVPLLKVDFTNGTDTVPEGSQINVKVVLDKDPERTITIPLSVTHHDGATADDYNVPTTVTFNSGQTEAYPVFSAVQDDIDEDDERVTLSFDTPLPERVTVGNPGMTDITITDDDGGDDDTPSRAGFEKGKYEVDEGDSVAVTVVLSKAADTDVTIGFELLHFDNIEAADYSGVPDSVTITSGTTEATFTVTAVDDELKEQDETLAIRFENLPSTIEIGTIWGTDVVIKDDDNTVQEVNANCPPDSGTRIILDEIGEISQAGETDFWRVQLDPWRVYIIEVLGQDEGADLAGVDSHTGDLTLADPELVAVWNEDRSRILRTYSLAARNGGAGRNSVVVDRANTPTGWHQFEVQGNGGTGTYQIKVRVNNVCSNGHYPWFGGPDGYVLDIPTDTSTNRRLSPHDVNVGPKGTGGYLGDNWDWYWDDAPDEDWIAADLLTGYEYTFDLWTPGDHPERHQATELKVLGIYGPDGLLIDNTASAGTGKSVSVVFSPGTEGRHHVWVGTGENDRTGVYKIRATARRLP